MHRILVATDASEGANRAIDAAAELAVRFDAELIVVNVEQGYLHGELETFATPESATMDEILTAASQEILRRAEQRAQLRGVTRIRTYSGLGDATGFVLQTARQEGPDLIVVGKRGKGRIAGLLIGSVSQKLVSLAQCKVLVVP